MAEGKYCKIDGVIKPIVGEYVKIGGVIKVITTNAIKVEDVIKPIELADRRIYVTEQISERCYRIKNDGAEDWYYTTGGLADPSAVAVDEDGNSYWACANNVYKLDNDGNLVTGWPYTGHGNPVKSIAVDADGYVYTGDLAGVVKKLSSAGVQQWSTSLGANYAVYALCVDHGSMVYAGTGWAYDAVYRLQIANGNSAVVYTSSGGDIISIAVDDDGRLYIGDNTGHYRQISAAGYVYWTQTPGGDVTQLVIGHDGYGYCSTGIGRKLIKFARSTGSSEWNYDPGGAACATGIGVDKGGKVYGAYRKTGVSVENVIRQVDKDGNWLWSWYPYTSAQMYKLAVTPGLKAAGFA